MHQMRANKLLINLIALYLSICSDAFGQFIRMDPAEHDDHNTKIIIQTLNTFYYYLLPLTEQQMDLGDRLFGGMMVLNDPYNNYPVMMIGTNRECTKNKLMHGEIETINNYYNYWDPNIDSFENDIYSEFIEEGLEYTNDYPQPLINQTIFINSFAPCPQCLSAISWNGFKQLYYLFTYEEAKCTFANPGNVVMQTEVFNNMGTEDDPYFNGDNAFWESHYIFDIIKNMKSGSVKNTLLSNFNIIKYNYVDLQECWQDCDTLHQRAASPLLRVMFLFQILNHHVIIVIIMIIIIIIINIFLNE